MPGVTKRTANPTPWSYWAFVLAGAPILAVAAAVFYVNLGLGDNGLASLEVVAPVGALLGAIFVLTPRLAGVTGPEALLGYVVAGLLTVPWSYGLLFSVFGVMCLAGDCPSFS